MKKYIISFLCVFSILFISLVFPFVSYGATTEYESGINWAGIVQDNGLNIGTNYVIVRDTSGYYYIAYNLTTYDNPGGEAITCNGASIASTNQITIAWTVANQRNFVYKSAQPYNPYGTYTSIQSDNHASAVLNNVSAVMANGNAITYNNVAVFPQTPLVQEQTVILSGVITSPILMGVLTEVTECLPILLPTVISLLSIRKGLRFTFKMLRRA